VKLGRKKNGIPEAPRHPTENFSMTVDMLSHHSDEGGNVATFHVLAAAESTEPRP
jgi:hypothetical protein